MRGQQEFRPIEAFYVTEPSSMQNAPPACYAGGARRHRRLALGRFEDSYQRSVVRSADSHRFKVAHHNARGL